MQRWVWLWFTAGCFPQTTPPLAPSPASTRPVAVPVPVSAPVVSNVPAVAAEPWDAFFATQPSESTGDEIVHATVVRIEAQEIYISAGATRGLMPNALLRIKRPIAFKHPITHELIRDWVPVGTAAITASGGELSRAVVGQLVAEIQVGDLAEVLVDHGTPPPVVAQPASDPDVAGVLAVVAAQSGQPLDARIAGWEAYLAQHPGSRFAAGIREELDELHALRDQIQPATAIDGKARISSVAHEPVRSARAHEALPLVFVLDQPDRIASAYLHYRPVGAPAYRAVLLTREHETYLRGAIPADVMAAPGVEYFVEVAAPSGASAVAVGSPQAPVAVEVAAPPLLETFAPRSGLSSVRMMVNALDFRTLDARTGDRTDHLYQATLDFTYWLGSAIESFGVGGGVYAGTGGQRDAVWSEAMPAPQTAFHFGYADVEFGGHLDTTKVTVGAQLIAGVGRDGFGMGGEGRFRIGSRLGTNLAFVARSVDQVGWLSEVRFGTRPIGPLGIGISVGATDQPTRGDTALVLGTELELFAIRNVSIIARGSWQGRSVDHAGLGGGGGVAFSW